MVLLAHSFNDARIELSVRQADLADVQFVQPHSDLPGFRDVDGRWIGDGHRRPPQRSLDLVTGQAREAVTTYPDTGYVQEIIRPELDAGEESYVHVEVGSNYDLPSASVTVVAQVRVSANHVGG